jgi:LemA protein
MENITLLVVLGIVVILGLYLWSTYNSLVRLNVRVDEAWSDITVQLKRRADLIPNLVESVKGYMEHERDTLQQVIEARNSAVVARDAAAGNLGSGAAVGSLNSAEQQLSTVLTKFMALSESYPDLKANQNVSNLMEELSSTENKVGFSRQAYNDAVMQYNIACETFPASVIAGNFGFAPMTQLESTSVAAEREAPRVAFH